MYGPVFGLLVLLASGDVGTEVLAVVTAAVGVPLEVRLLRRPRQVNGEVHSQHVRVVVFGSS